MTYRQTSGWTEDGWGAVELLFVVSDTYEGLFASAEDSTGANIFTLSDVTRGIKNKTGGLIEHELTFSLNEARCQSPAELAALEFVKAARDASVKRFAALFVNATDPPATDEMLFNGIFQPEFEGEDIRWFGEQFTTTPTPLRVWKAKIKPFSIEAFKNFSLHDLIHGNSTNDIPGISEAFEAANVSDRQGYFLWSARNNRAVKVYQLVSLNKILRVLADNLTSALQANGFGTINFSFQRSILDGSWHPARWVQSKIKPHPDDSYKYPRFTYCFKVSSSGTSAFYAESERGQADHFVYLNDKQVLAIDPDGTPTNAETIWINYDLIKKCIDDDPQEKVHEPFRWEKKCKDFMELLEKLAFSLGCFYVMEYVSTEELSIRFVSRQDFVSDQIYLKTAVKGSIKITAQQLNESDGIKGKSCSVADEGRKYLRKHSDATGERYVQVDGDNTSENNILLTISPTTVIYSDGGIDDDNQWYSYARYPYNTYFTDNETVVTRTGGRAPGLHTGMYLYVGRTASHALYGDDERTPQNWWTPAACLTANINGKDKRFYSLEEYLDELYVLDKEFYQSEYNLEVPGYYYFSPNANGSSPNWNTIDIGGKIELDGDIYTIVNIKWNLQKPLVTLILQSAARFDFNAVTTTALPLTEPLVPGLQTNNGNIEYGIAGEAAHIKYGQVVAEYDDGIFAVGEPHSVYANQFYGIALGDAEQYGIFPILRSGEFEVPEAWDDMTVGQLFFLRRPDENGRNISPNPLTSRTDNENMYVYVGKASGTRTIEIFEGFPKQFRLYYQEPQA